MKKTYKILRIALLLFVMSMSHGLMSQNFTHPGIPLSASDLATVKSHITAGDQPWKQGYDNFAADGRSSLNYTMMGPCIQVARNYGGQVHDINLNRWRHDMTAAYNLAVMWYCWLSANTMPVKILVLEFLMSLSEQQMP
jgi:hypothetical protein